ncbi:MAG: FxLYD domain-containing protein [Dehalococcoidia bacterium]|jgi:hypothetical protein
MVRYSLIIFSWIIIALALSCSVIAEEKQTETKPLLLVHNMRSRIESDYVIVEGMVENIGDIPLKSIACIVMLFDAREELVTSSEALTKFNPILPKQKSPFRVMVKYNWDAKTYSIDFQRLFGPTIPWKSKSGFSAKTLFIIGK